MITTTLKREFDIPTKGDTLTLNLRQMTRFLGSRRPALILPDHGECQIWQGSLTEAGYGRFYFGRDSENRTITLPAHVVAYKLWVGPVPPLWIVDHMCNNKACSEPEHLECITEQLNFQRASERRPWDRQNQYARNETRNNRDDWRHKL